MGNRKKKERNEGVRPGHGSRGPAGHSRGWGAEPAIRSLALQAHCAVGLARAVHHAPLCCQLAKQSSVYSLCRRHFVGADDQRGALARPLSHAGTSAFDMAARLLQHGISPPCRAVPVLAMRGRWAGAPSQCSLRLCRLAAAALLFQEQGQAYRHAPWFRHAVQVVGAVGWNKERLPVPCDIPQGMQDLIAACFGEPQGRPSFRWAADRPFICLGEAGQPYLLRCRLLRGNSGAAKSGLGAGVVLVVLLPLDRLLRRRLGGGAGSALVPQQAARALGSL